MQRSTRKHVQMQAESGVPAPGGLTLQAGHVCGAAGWVRGAFGWVRRAAVSRGAGRKLDALSCKLGAWGLLGCAWGVGLQVGRVSRVGALGSRLGAWRLQPGCVGLVLAA